MCGFAGFLTSASMEADAMSAALEPMIRCLVHRGPDQHGVWTSPKSGIALGFRRLAIVDLSEEGDQPMMSASRRYAMTYNGEVYNFGELRTQLQARGHRFRGHSDTEVILAAFEEWGIEASFPRFNGMFALAVWDDKQKVLLLVLCSQSLFRFADLGDDGLCRGGPDKGCGVIVSAIDVVVDRLD